MKIFSDLLDFLYPKSEEVLSLESLNAGELVTLLPQATELDDRTLAIWNYADPRVRELIWELKYRKNPVIVKNLAEVLFDVLRQELAERALFENFINPLLIPMPQSDKRRLERGFNPTEVLCACLDSLARREEPPLFTYSPKILIKELHTESQTKTANKKIRLTNIENSMAVAGPEGAKRLKGRNIILIDDVTTTGATFKEASRALRAAGSKKILCLALAH
jgi:ComF family protein